MAGTRIFRWLWIGACLWLAQAQAAIVVVHRADTGLPNVFRLGAAAFNTTPFDINGDGVADFTFSNSSGLLAVLYPEGGSRVVAIPPVLIESGGHAWHVDPKVIPLGAGTLIGSDAVFSIGGEWYGDVSLLGYTSGGGLQFSNAYIGVEFQIGENTHYGWIHYVGWGVSHEHGLPSGGNIPGGWVNTWAYNSIPGAPIYAGQIPEPSTPLLAGIAGLASAFARRRRTT